MISMCLCAVLVLAHTQNITYTDASHHFNFAPVASYTPDYNGNGTANPSNTLKTL